MKKKLVYVAHPYGGKKSNKEKIDKIMQELVMAGRLAEVVKANMNTPRNMVLLYLC